MKRILWICSLLGCAALLAGCDDDSGSPQKTPSCGDGTCNNGETFQTCPADCEEESDTWCGDGFCDDDETEDNCAKDCKKLKRAVCGNNTCEPGENLVNCSQDCEPICGDGRCEGGETEATCKSDCEEVVAEAVCGNKQCEEGENDSTDSHYCERDCRNIVYTAPMSLEEYNDLNETSERHFLFDYDKAMNPVVPVKDGPTKKDAMNDFLAFPFPNVIRTDEYGRPSLKGYPAPEPVISFILGDIVDSLVEKVQKERAGFSPLGAVYFRSSVPIDSTSWRMDFMNTASPSSCVQLINVEPESRHYKERLPVYVTFQNNGNDLWADNTLVVRPVPGVNPHPGDRHMAVILDCMTYKGTKIDQSDKLSAILNKTSPHEINSLMSFYVDQLSEVGIDPSKVRALTGYDTMDVAKEMDQMAADLKGKGKIVKDSNGVAVGSWREVSGVSVFSGQFETYNYIEGVYNKEHPDYTGPGMGEIRFDANGKLTSKGNSETINFQITVPKTAMPANGYPIAVYGHGTGGDASTHVGRGDEGWSLIDNNIPIAMIGFDACLQGERTDGDGSEAALMTMLLQNPVVIRESVRQTVNDMLVLYDIFDQNGLILPPNPRAENPSENVRFDPSYGLFVGHSQGSQEGGVLLGVTNQIKNAFLSAGGGGVALSFVELELDIGIKMFEHKTIADIVSMVFGQTGNPISYDTFLTNHIVQPLLDPIDPLNFAYRFIKEPPAGMSAKNIAQTMGVNDQCTPMVTQMAMATAEGLPVVGNIYEVSDAMRYAGFDTALDSPVSKNLTSTNGDVVTGGIAQFENKGTGNPHFVLYHIQGAGQMYLEFFRSVMDGTPKIIVDTSKQSGSY